MALDREQVVKAAINLLDEVGLEGLSLRRLAKELGVQAPALYWHFDSKQALLDRMSETIAAEEMPSRLLGVGQTWDDWLAQKARDMRAALNRHRDGAMLAASTQPQVGQWRDIEAELTILMNGGLTPAQAMHAMIAVGNYVSGFTLDEQAERQRGEQQEHDEEEWMAALEPYPVFKAAILAIGDPQSDGAFEAGLALILAGIRAGAA